MRQRRIAPVSSATETDLSERQYDDEPARGLTASAANSIGADDDLALHIVVTVPIEEPFDSDDLQAIAIEAANGVMRFLLDDEYPEEDE